MTATVAKESLGKSQLLYLRGVKIPADADGALVFVNPAAGEVLNENSPSYIGAVAPGLASGDSPSPSNFVLSLEKSVASDAKVVLRPANKAIPNAQIEIREATITSSPPASQKP